MNLEIIKLSKISDERGDLITFLRNSQLECKEFGQIYFVTFDKPCLRGNHYHKTYSEWFGIAKGVVVAHLEDIDTKEKQRIVLDSKDKDYKLLHIGKEIAHAFVALSPAVLLNYMDKEWIPNDTFKYIVV